MRRRAGKYIKDYAPSTLKAFDGPHTSIGLSLISIEGSSKKAAGTGCFFAFFEIGCVLVQAPGKLVGRPLEDAMTVTTFLLFVPGVALFLPVRVPSPV